MKLNTSCGLSCCFYQLFGFSFWRHLFTIHLLVSKYISPNATWFDILNINAMIGIRFQMSNCVFVLHEGRAFIEQVNHFVIALALYKGLQTIQLY